MDEWEYNPDHLEDIALGAALIDLGERWDEWLVEREDVISYWDPHIIERRVSLWIDLPRAEGSRERSAWPESLWGVPTPLATLGLSQDLVSEICDGHGHVLRHLPSAEMHTLLGNGLVAVARQAVGVGTLSAVLEADIRAGTWRTARSQYMEDGSRAEAETLASLSTFQDAEDTVAVWSSLRLLAAYLPIQRPLRVVFTLRESLPREQRRAFAASPRGTLWPQVWRLLSEGADPRQWVSGRRVDTCRAYDIETAKSYRLIVEQPLGTAAYPAITERIVDTEGKIHRRWGQVQASRVRVVYQKPEGVPVIGGVMFVAQAAEPSAYVGGAFWLALWQTVVILTLGLFAQFRTDHLVAGAASLVVLVPSLGGPLLLAAPRSDLQKELNRPARHIVLALAMVSSLAALGAGAGVKHGWALAFWYGTAAVAASLTVFLGFAYSVLRRGGSGGWGG